MTFTTKETATILAALRYWQSVAITDHRMETGTIVRPTACNSLVYFEEDEPLNKQEIDDLCGRINTDEEQPDHDETDKVCTCGDPDCNRIMGHEVEDALTNDDIEATKRFDETQARADAINRHAKKGGD